MSATIIEFPRRAADAERLALVGDMLAQAVTFPSADPELDLLLTIGAKLIDNVMDYQAVDCWLVRADEWEAGKRASAPSL